MDIPTVKGQQPMAKVLRRRRLLSFVSEVAACEEDGAVGAVVAVNTGPDAAAVTGSVAAAVLGSDDAATIQEVIQTA